MTITLWLNFTQRICHELIMHNLHLCVCGGGGGGEGATVLVKQLKLLARRDENI